MRNPIENEPAPYYVFGTAGQRPLENPNGQPCAGMVGFITSLIGVFGVEVWKDLQTATPVFVGNIAGTSPVLFANDFNGLVIQRDAATANAGNLWLLDAQTLSELTIFTLPDAVTGQSNVGATAVANAAPGTEVCGSLTELDNYTYYAVKNSPKMYASFPTNPTDISGANFATKEARTDNISRILVCDLNIWVMGTDSIEIYYDAGIVGFPATRYQNAMFEKGILAKFSAAEFHDNIYYLASDGKIYRGSGLSQQAISPDWFAQYYAQISASDPGALVNAWGVTYSSSGYDYYCLTIPGYISLEFNLTTGFWHNKTSAGIPYWNGKTCAELSGHFYVGDAVAGTVYEMVAQYTNEGTTPIYRQVVTPSFGPKDDRTSLYYVDIDFNTANSTDYATQTLNLSYSDDEGRTWSTPRTPLLPILNVRRCIERTFGWMRRRQLKISYQGDVPFRIDNLYIGMGIGWPKTPYIPGQSGLPPNQR